MSQNTNKAKKKQNKTNKQNKTKTDKQNTNYLYICLSPSK